MENHRDKLSQAKSPTKPPSSRNLRGGLFFSRATKRPFPAVYTDETQENRSADASGEEREGFPLISPKQAWTAEALIDAYGDELLRLCLLYLGDRQLAEDAFQETMVKAWRALPDFRGESGAKTWLFHIAVNTCRDMLRSGWMRMAQKKRAAGGHAGAGRAGGRASAGADRFRAGPAGANTAKSSCSFTINR